MSCVILLWRFLRLVICLIWTNFFKGSNSVTSKEILPVSAGNEKIVIGQFITDQFGLLAFLSPFPFPFCLVRYMVAKMLIFHDSPKEDRQEFVELVSACLIAGVILRSFYASLQIIICNFAV